MALPEVRTDRGWRSGATFIWVAVAFLLLAREVWVNGRFYLHIRGLKPIEDPVISGQLKEVSRQIGLRRVPIVKETPRITAPAVSGVCGLQVLLPAGLRDGLSAESLRYVLLHELAHGKRGDLVVNWLVHTLQTLHWFNPAIWWAFHRLRMERELATDELVLGRLQPGENIHYGRSIVRLLETFGRPASHSGLVGMVTEKQQMKRRIQMIADYKSSTGHQLRAVLTGLGLAVATLTAGQNESDPGGQVDKEDRSGEQPEVNEGETAASPSEEEDLILNSRIQLKAKFIKLTPNAADRLGLNWIYPNSQETSSAKKEREEASTVTRVSLGSLSLANFTLILTSEQAAVWQEAMEQRQGAEVLEGLVITTLSGKEAELASTVNKKLVTGVDVSAEKVNYRTEAIPTGPRLKVLPVIHADGYTVELKVDADLMEFDRYLKGGIGRTDSGMSYEIPKPQMRNRKLRTRAVMHPGQTLVLSGGSIWRESEFKVDGKVRFTGESERLMVMISMRLMGSDGRPLFEQGDLPFDPESIPYQATTQLLME